MSFLDLIPGIPRIDIVFDKSSFAEDEPVTLQDQSDKESEIFFGDKASPTLKQILELVETLPIEELNELNDYIWDRINK